MPRLGGLVWGSRWVAEYVGAHDTKVLSAGARDSFSAPFAYGWLRYFAKPGYGSGAAKLIDDF